LKNKLMKATAVVPSNISFIKYWGRKDEALRLPENGSISMNLSNLLTTTTVEFNPDFKVDLVTINSEKEENEGSRVIKHLDRIRRLAKINYKAKVVSKNNFPTGTGLSSSASGFAALTLAASKAAGLSLSEKELSILARQGSGSACRSIPDGFVEWLDGDTSETSYAVSIFPPDYWDIVDVVAIVSKNKKEVSTTEGQQFARSSPFFPVRLSKIKEKIKLIKKYIQEKNFPLFGELIEQEALELHAIMLTSIPSLIYWLPATVSVMHAVQKWRNDGLEVYFTVNTGQNIHLICQKKDAELVSKRASKVPEVRKIVINYPSVGARIVSRHLF
jgi:diphosphomevalonate decarboxylase